jgi:hypothetical protein
MKAEDLLGTIERSKGENLAQDKLLIRYFPFSHLSFSFSRTFSSEKKRCDKRRFPPSLQDGSPCPAGCPNLMIRGRLPHRFLAHGTDGSFSHPFSTALSTPKRSGIPRLVDKMVDNVDNFPGQTVDKWRVKGS